MDKQEFEIETLDFFKQTHSGGIKKYSLQKEFEDDGIKQFIAKVETTIDNYWIIGSDEYGLIVYGLSSGGDANEIYKFHREEIKNHEDNLSNEEDSVIYGEEHLSDDFVKAIGRLTINFAHLEFTLSLFCGSHMGVSHPINEIITSELSIKQLLNISSAIYQQIELDGNKLKQFSELVKETFKLEESRNTIIHSCYAGHSSQRKMIRQKSTAKAKRGFKLDYQEINAKEVNELADKMNELSRKFIGLIYLRSEK